MGMPYPDSYYRATSSPLHRSGAMQGDQHFDVGIVGGGFTGLSAAIELARAGFRVAVFEANAVGWGASGRNGGQMLFGFADHPTVEAQLGAEAGKLAYELSIECRELVEQRIAEYEIDCDLTYGYVHAAWNQRQLRGLADDRADLMGRGYPADLVMLDDKTIQDHLRTERYAGGLYDPSDTHLHPLKLCFAEAAAAQKSGVHLFETTRVKSISRRNGDLVLETPSGNARCSFALVACNAYLGAMVPPLKGMVLPAGSYIIATEPLGDTAREVIPTNVAVSDQNTVLDYYRLSADQRMLFGGRCNYSGREPKDVVGSLRPRMLKLFPQLESSAIEFAWGGQVAVTLNRLPQLGRIEPNLYYAQGYSGHGVAASHLAGKLVAEAIRNQSERFDVMANIKHRRLPGGPWLASNMLALGMMWYRLRDLVGI